MTSTFVIVISVGHTQLIALIANKPCLIWWVLSGQYFTIIFPCFLISEVQNGSPICLGPFNYKMRIPNYVFAHNESQARKEGNDIMVSRQWL